MSRICFLCIGTLLIIIQLALYSCGERPQDGDVTPPQLTITAPAEGVEILGGLNFDVICTDESLHNFLILLTSDQDEAVLHRDELDIHDRTYFKYDKSYAFSDSTGMKSVPATLLVIVEDHSGLETRKEVHFILKSQ